jgi:cytochrome c
MPAIWLILTLLMSLSAASAQAADLRGHGGPVRAIAIAEDGMAATASFDTTIIRWDVRSGQAKTVLRFHEGAANAVLALPGGWLASAGEDRRIALWAAEGTAPARVLEGHEAPIVGLALSPDGKSIASASWDGTVRLWPLDGGAPRVLAGHRGNVNAVLFQPDGTLVSAGYDGTIRFWREGQEVRVLEFGLPQNALAQAGQEVIAAGADGQLRFITSDNGRVEPLAIAEAPLVALAASRDGRMLGATGFRGALVLIDARTRNITRRMMGPAFPLWSLAFSPDGAEILTGGADRLVRRWHVATGEPVNPVLIAATDEKMRAFAGHPGAEVYRACIACHTLDADDGNRAGPTLFGVFGRKVGTAKGYQFSPALSGRDDIIWSRETVSRLFEIGPNAMLPGTKMPEQIVGNAADREALMDFLDKAAR